MAIAQPRPSPEPSLTGTSIGRFSVRELLGRGGMGEVYRAEDTVLKRTVALKRVAPRLRTDPRSRKRVLKEAERASALNSPHIAAIHDVVEENEDVFLVMEYVEGVTLREQMHAALALPQFLNIAAQCAEALACAHRKRIVHGDLKPENIMVAADGTVKVLDFGLARRVADDGAAPLDSTQSAMLAGTPGYIPPEVLLAKEPDARSDIFSLGVVFYEALTRQHPFAGKSFSEAVNRTLHHEPAALHTLVPAAPAELDWIIAKMLAKDPAERYATAADLLVDLHRLQHGTPAGHPPAPRLRRWAARVVRIAAAVLLVLILVSIMPNLRQRWKRWRAGPDLPEVKTVAVLPFESVDKADTNTQVFAAGITANVTDKLSGLKQKYRLQVVPRSAMNKVESVDQARQEAGATLVLEGHVYRAEGEMRVTYTLVDAVSRRALRNGEIVHPVTDLFAVERGVVDGVLRSLEVELTVSDRQLLAARGTGSREAYEAYQRGLGFLENYEKSENIEGAIAEFNRSLEHDRNFPLAYAALGEAFLDKYNEVSKDAVWLLKAEENCRLAEKLGAGHDCLGMVYNERGRFQEAAAQFQSALQQDSTDDDAYRGLGAAYEQLGNIKEAENTYRLAIAQRPQYWAGHNWLAGFLFDQKRYDEAIDAYRNVVRLAPDNYRGYANLCGVYIAKKRYDAAVDSCRRSIAIRGNVAAFNQLGSVYFYQGEFAAAAGAFNEAVRLKDDYRKGWANLAESQYWGGLRREAVESYRRAISLGEKELSDNPRNATLSSYLGLYYAMLQQRAKAVTYRDQALRLEPRNADVLFNAALIANQFGESTRALDSIQEALDAGLPPEFVRSAPYFKNLQSNTRYRAILKRFSRPS